MTDQNKVLSRSARLEDAVRRLAAVLGINVTDLRQFDPIKLEMMAKDNLAEKIDKQEKSAVANQIDFLKTLWLDGVQSGLTNEEVRARQFAFYHHGKINHLRKYTGQPYISHPLEVANIVKSARGTVPMIQAAILHDVVEDTEATIEDVKAVFGDEVAELVDMLTDVSKLADGTRAYRKALDRNHLACASPDAKTIKLADIISNTESVMKHDPAFAKGYLIECYQLVQVLKEGNEVLWHRANGQIYSELVGLGIDPATIIEQISEPLSAPHP